MFTKTVCRINWCGQRSSAATSCRLRIPSPILSRTCPSKRLQLEPIYNDNGISHFSKKYTEHKQQLELKHVAAANGDHAIITISMSGNVFKASKARMGIGRSFSGSASGQSGPERGRQHC